MRKSSTIEALLPATRREVLRLTYGQPERWWYLSELAAEIGTSPSSLQREIEALTSAALLEKRTEGRRTYYRPLRANAIFGELRSIVDKTMGASREIRTALEKLPRVEVAFLYGSAARGEDRATSDLDVFVVGDVGLSKLAPATTRLERRLGRAVNPTVMSAAELRRRNAIGDHFVIGVLRGKKEFLIGSEDDLAAMAR